MNKVLLLTFSLFLFCSCKNDKSKEDFSTAPQTEKNKETSEETEEYDTVRGEGKFKVIELGLSLDKAMAEEGLKIAALKCTACHKTTDEILVGPGWKGVTHRRKPEWIMNFITNPDPMIDKDPALQAQLELCLIRMPNQALTDKDARAVLEYMRQIDGVK